MNKNEGKSIKDCLQLLIKDLRYLQYGLDSGLRTADFLYNKLLLAYQDMPACQYACYKPADTMAGFINDLRSSITTFQKTHLETANDVFTDRRYYKQDQLRPSLRYYDRNQTYKKDDKKCFIYKRTSCWSNKYTKEERTESIKKYKEELGRRFDNRARQYIADYKGDDKDNDSDSLDAEIEALTIDIALEPAEPEPQESDTSAYFFTSYERLRTQNP